MPLPIIFSDLDGVVCNIMERVTLAIWRDFGVLVPQELSAEYNAGKSLYPCLSGIFDTPVGLDKYIWNRVFNNPKELRAAKPYYHMLALYHEFIKRGGKLLLVTSRPPSVYDPTAEWCGRWQLPKATCSVQRVTSKELNLRVFLHNLRGGTSNLGWSQNLEVWVIDDDPKVLDVYDHMKDSCLTKIFCMPRPWNAHWASKNTEPDDPVVMLQELLSVDQNIDCNK